MCGILGQLLFNSAKQITRNSLKYLSSLLMHRGPDDSGEYLDDDIALAMRRLSIVDIKGGRQPIRSKNKRFILIFNGEIYNYRELRQQLETQGYRFRTKSDTEIILQLYIEKGPECLQCLNGMFAFAIWDSFEKKLFLARDRVGIKPLYFVINSKRFFFSSELTPIIRSNLFNLNYDYRSVMDCMSYWYICQPRSIFNEVKQLEPGHYAIIHKGNIHQHSYWKIPILNQKKMCFSDTVEQLNSLIEDAVKIRMAANEVPVGTFLSGGIDSGLITALSSQFSRRKLKAFSIGFSDPSYCELELTKKTASRLKNIDLYSTCIDVPTSENLDEIFDSLDEPLGNASFIPTYFLAKQASKHLKVVLTGDGGDEIFGGYPTYQSPYYQTLYNLVPDPLSYLMNRFISNLPVSHKRISLEFRLKQLMKGLPLSYQRAHYTWRQITEKNVLTRLLKQPILDLVDNYDPFEVTSRYFDECLSLSKKNQLMYVDLKTYLLNDHLRKIDRMTMAHSLEARTPFLDHRIIEFSVGMPEEYKVTALKTKKILKTIASNYLPKVVIKGKKKGLTSPINTWIHKGLRSYVMDNLKGYLADEVFNRTMIDKIVSEHMSLTKDNSRIIWSMLALQMWSKKISKTQFSRT